MSANELVPGLNLFTLIAILVIAGGALLFFLRKRRNRHPMDTPEGHAADEARRRDAEARRQEP